MSLNESIEKSHGVAATVGAVATESSMTPEQRIFMNMELNKSNSVLQWIPLVEGKGKNGLVPTHIRACSVNPREIVREIQLFRDKRQSDQVKDVKEWGLMSRSKQES
jgi:hypothetical protein